MTDNPGEPRHCLNCGAALGGQYCGQCGQRARSRLISLWELVSDAFGDLFELDSRLWRTLVPMLIRPGLLTRDYLEGRRARFMPPFRMYLVLSLIFFLVAFFNPRDDLAIFFEPAAPAEPTEEPSEEPSEEQRSQREEEVRAAKETAREVLEELAEDGIIAAEVLEQDEPLVVNGETDDDGFNVSIDGEELDMSCEAGQFDVGDAPAWLKRRLTTERLVELCERWQVVGADGLAAAVVDKVPAALIVLLPLMALALKILYPLSRRYYVEHLLFVVHFHAFFFLLLTLQILWVRLVGMLGLAEVIAVLPVVATSFYIPAYLFMAMREVYGQDKMVTFIKFFFLSLTYLLGFTIVMLGTLLVAVFSV
jgi:hypothetical protein